MSGYSCGARNLNQAKMLERLCQVLGVSRSGFYRYLKGETYSVSEQKQEQYQQIEDLFWEHKRRYGTRRLQAELMAQGKQIGRHQIRKVLKEKELKAIQPSRYYAAPPL